MRDYSTIQSGIAVSIAAAGVLFGSGCSEEEASATPTATERSQADPQPPAPDLGLDLRQASQPNADDMSDAKRWVLANRTIRDDTDRLLAEVEATLLELVDDIMAGGELPAGRMIHLLALMQNAELAADADLDGTVSDEERERLEEFGDLDDPTGHPYLAKHYDTDGDGVISDEERAEAEGKFQGMMMDAIAPSLEVLAEKTLDADGDGFISEEERAAADARLDRNGDGEVSDQERGMQMMMSAGPTFMAVQAALRGGEDLPPPPSIEMGQFDSDGDGQYSEAEMAAYMEEAGPAYERWQQEYESARAERSLNRHDLDSNGEVDFDERRYAIDNDRRRAERVLVMQRYDGDSDGRISSSELSQFAEWHRQGAPRADADADGKVTPADLKLMMNLAAE